MRRCCAGDSMMVLIVFPLYADSDSDCKFERDIQEANKWSRITEGVHLVHPTPCGDVMCALRLHRAPWNWIQTCSALVSQATPLCECTCSTCSISSSGRVRVAGGHAATKHQLDKTSGSLYRVQRDCATLII